MPFFSMAHIQHTVPMLPAVLHKSLTPPQSVYPAIAAAQPIILEWCQSSRPLLNPPPLHAYAFCPNGKC